SNCGTYLIRRFVELFSVVIFGKEPCEFRGSAKPGDDARACERMHAASVFPEIPSCLRQAGSLVAVIGQEMSRPSDQVSIDVMREFDIAQKIIVLPHCPKDKCRFVFLYRNEPFAAKRVPKRMPAGRDGSVRIVF